jgi:hypothetical protein
MPFRGHSVTETRDFSEFKVPMLPIPERVEAAIARGVLKDRELPFSHAGRLLDPEADGPLMRLCAMATACSSFAARRKCLM